MAPKAVARSAPLAAVNALSGAEAQLRMLLTAVGSVSRKSTV